MEEFEPIVGLKIGARSYIADICQDGVGGNFGG